MSKVKFVSANDREAVLLALEEAAQEIADKMALLREVLKEDALAEMQSLTASEYREDALVCLSETHQQLGAELGEVGPKIGEQLGEEYELIGTIDGTHGGRWVLAVKDKAAVWPLGAAVYVKMYVRRIKR